MRIVVTGGSGFIGSHVVDHLRDAGHEVALVDLRPPHRPDVAHHAVDIGDLEGLVRATAGADVVFHLAAVSDVNDVAREPVGAADLNVVGTARVWEACRRNGVKRAILASTVWVYSGATGEAPLDEASPFDLPRAAGHLYTSSKVGAELVVHSYHAMFDQEFTILRYGIPYGPRMRPSLVIPRFVRMALAGEPITMDGDGQQYRNYVYVGDLAEAHVLALGAAGANQVFNLEGREPITIRYLVDCVGEATGRPVEVVRVPARTGDYGGTVVSAAKAARLLGWEPSVSFDDGLRRYVAWHLSETGPAFTPVPTAAVEAMREPVAAAIAAPDAGGPARDPAGPRRMGFPARPRRIGSFAGMAAGLSLATLAVPALAGSTAAGSGTHAIAVLGSCVAAAGAALVAGRRRRPDPVGFGLVGVVLAIWLLSQVTPGPTALLVSLLLGASVGAALPEWEGVRLEWRAALAGVVGLASTTAGSPRSLFWAAAVVVAVPAVAAAVDGARPVLSGWRRRMAPAAAIVVAAGLMTSWVGATSAQASWFGPVVSHGPRSEGRVAITFDGSPDFELAARLVAVLDAHHVRATFFTNGRSVETAPAVAQTLLAHGQLLGNAAHTPDADAWLDPGSAQLARAEGAFDRALSVCPAYFRPPAGRHTPLMARVVRHHRMTMVTWDVQGSPGGDLDANELARRVLAKVRPGSIVDFDLGAGSPSAASAVVDALPIVLDTLAARGLEAVRLDELLHTAGYVGSCPVGSPEGTGHTIR